MRERVRVGLFMQGKILVELSNTFENLRRSRPLRADVKNLRRVPYSTHSSTQASNEALSYLPVTVVTVASAAASAVASVAPSSLDLSCCLQLGNVTKTDHPDPLKTVNVSAVIWE